MQEDKNFQTVLLEYNISMLKTMNHIDRLLTEVLDLWKEDAVKDLKTVKKD